MNKFLIAQTVAGVLLSSSALIAASSAAQAAELGYGTFLGTWDICSGKPAVCAGNPDNPTPDNVAYVGSLILEQYPGMFDINEFNLAGGSGTYPSIVDYIPGEEGFQPSASTGLVGTWIYKGFAADPPGDDPVDLYIAVKYASYYSVFYYDEVKVLDTGTFTSDPSNLVGVSGGTCTFVDYFSPNCMPGNPQEISHVIAYWPPGTTGGDPGCTTCVPVPEPTTLALFGAGLFGLGLVRRRYRF